MVGRRPRSNLRQGRIEKIISISYEQKGYNIQVFIEDLKKSEDDITDNS